MDDLVRHSAWLKRLARRLVSDPNLAEDLVQETWVNALENPPTHTGNLRGWLSRVLRNRASTHFRSQTRRQSREQRRAEIDDAKFADASQFAQQVVERGEISQMLAESVMALAEPFRSTLLMRYHEEMSTTQIAERMHVPVSTVRTRIKRGLDRLRKVVQNRHGKGWSDCHNALILYAGVQSVPWWTPMKAGIAAILAVATFALLSVQPWAQEEQSLTYVDANGTTPASAQATPSSSSQLPGFGRTPSEEESNAKSGSAAMGEEIVIQGRCVDGINSDPVEGVHLTFASVVYKNSGERLVREGWEQPMEMTTAADGLFEFRTPQSDGKLLFELTMTHPAYMTRFGEWISNENPLESTDFADVPMHSGSTVSGTVRDQEGTLLSGVKVRFELPASQNLIPKHSDPLFTEAITDSNGNFQLPSVAPAGRHAIELKKTAFLQSGPYYLEIPASGTLHSDLSMQPAPALQGQINFADGTPAASVQVKVATPIGIRTPTFTTESDGSFCIYSDGSNIQEPLALAILNTGGQSHQSRVTDAVHHWNDEDIQLTVEPALHLVIEVVADDTGDPIEWFKARCSPVDPDWRLHVDDYSDPQRHIDGKLRLEGLNSGPHRLAIEPLDRSFRASKNLEVTPGLNESDPIQIRLKRFEPLEIHVRKPDGTPAVQSRIHLHVQSEEVLPVYLEGGKTDSNGVLTTYYPPQATTIFFTLTGDHAALSGSFDLIPSDPHRAVIEVQPLVELNGTLVCDDALRDVATLFFEKASSEGGLGFFGSNDRRLTKPTAAGDFTIRLEEGVYNVYLKLLNDRWDQVNHTVRKWLDVGPPLAQIEVDSESTQPIQIDATNLAIFDFEGRVFLDGELLRNTKFLLQRFPFDPSNPRVSNLGYYYTDENGSFQMKHAIGGHYRISLEGGESGKPWPMALTSDGRVTIESAPYQSQEFHIQTRTLRLRPLHWETGAPMAGTTWTTGHLSTELIADEEGWLTVTPCALACYFHHKGSYGTILVGLVELDPLLVEQEIEIQVDPPRPF